MARRRIAYWDGTLSAAEADLLENLPGWTWGKPRRKSWRAALSALSDELAARPDTDLSSTLVIDVSIWSHGRTPSAQPTRMASSPTPRFSCSKPYPPGCGTTTPFVGKPGALHSRCTSESTMVPMSLAQRAPTASTWANGCSAAEKSIAPAPCPGSYRRTEQAPRWRWGRESDAWIQGISALRPTPPSTEQPPPDNQRSSTGSPSDSGSTTGAATTKPAPWRSRKSPPSKRCPAGTGILSNTMGERFSVLTQFVANSGHARPSKSAVTGTYPLGEWVSTQRKHHHRGILSDARLRTTRTTSRLALDRRQTARVNPASEPSQDNPLMLASNLGSQRCRFRRGFLLSKARRSAHGSLGTKVPETLNGDLGPRVAAPVNSRTRRIRRIDVPDRSRHHYFCTGLINTPATPLQPLRSPITLLSAEPAENRGVHPQSISRFSNTVLRLRFQDPAHTDIVGFRRNPTFRSTQQRNKVCFEGGKFADLATNLGEMLREHLHDLLTRSRPAVMGGEDLADLSQGETCRLGAADEPQTRKRFRTEIPVAVGLSDRDGNHPTVLVETQRLRATPLRAASSPIFTRSLTFHRTGMSIMDDVREPQVTRTARRRADGERSEGGVK